MMKKVLIVVLLTILSLPLFSQKNVLSGYLRDSSSKEALIGATVYVPELKIGITSNLYGFFSLSLPKGSYTVMFSYIGYETQKQVIKIDNNIQKEILLNESALQVAEVVVTGEKKNRNVESVAMSMDKLPIQMVKKLPSFMGEVDVLKTITLLPGIQNGGEGSSGLYVRGGGPDENLMILDEAPVYNASHLLGFFSVFNSDAIKDLQVYKGGIPAEYGGKASSVIDIIMKDGNAQSTHFNGGIGNISSRLTLEGPIIKNKWSYIVSARRTYADFVGKLAGVKELKGNQLYFYDLNLKTNYTINEKNRIFISAYTGDDNFKFGESIYMRWGNLTATARWNHLFSERLFSNTSLIYSRYNYNIGVPGNTAEQFDWKSQIKDFNLKQDFSWYANPNNKVTYGLNIILHNFNPGTIDANEKSYFSDLKLSEYNALENAAYISNEQRIGGNITLRYGLRYSLFQQIGEGKVRTYLHPDAPKNDEVIETKEYKKGDLIGSAYGNLEPRIAMKYSLTPESSIKASYNRMVQNLHLISNTSSPTPLDVWMPSNKYIKPLIADQVGLGYFRNFDNNTFETSAEIYYKDMKNVVDYKDGAELFLKEDLETELLRGRGYSYGFEMLIKKQQGNFTGWLAYTLARTMREIPGINDGNPYPASYDRTHDISIVLNYEMNRYWNFSSSWVYSTGNATSYPIAKYNIQGNNVYYYSARNSNRLPDYHRLDFSVNYNFKKNDRRQFKQSINLSVYNAYARRNAYSVTFKQNKDNPNISEATRLSIVGSVIPAITYNFNF